MLLFTLLLFPRLGTWQKKKSNRKSLKNLFLLSSETESMKKCMTRTTGLASEEMASVVFLIGAERKEATRLGRAVIYSSVEQHTNWEKQPPSPYLSLRFEASQLSNEPPPPPNHHRRRRHRQLFFPSLFFLKYFLSLFFFVPPFGLDISSFFSDIIKID